MKPVPGGITAPEGFLAAGASIGIKKSRRKDLALILTRSISSAAGVFTTNRVKAAPVLISQKQIKEGIAQAIVINSGNANCSTGEKGMRDASRMVTETAAALRVSPHHVLVASTGTIGVPMPIDTIIKGIWALAPKVSRDGGMDAAEAIMTTDKMIKEAAFEIPLKKGQVMRIGGMAKGSGMIDPKMATMIAVITTDANIRTTLLRKILLQVTEKTFNCLSIDGDRSTNDTVFSLANGLSKTQEIVEFSDEYDLFVEAFEAVCLGLSRDIARDGEGATRFLEIHVNGAKTEEDAVLVAKRLVTSPLVKTAVHGADPNWGRLLAAAGSSGVAIVPEKITVSVGPVKLVQKGEGVKFDAAKVRKLLHQKEVLFSVDLGLGAKSGRAFGCDLSADYVAINAKYHT